VKRVGSDARERAAAALERDPQLVWMSIDPSSTRTGLAVWWGQHLVSVEARRARRRVAGESGPSVERMLRQLQHWTPLDTQLLAVEWPRVYAAGSRRIDPAGPLAVAAAAGMWIGAAMCTARVGAPEVVIVEASAWKGQTPKQVMGERILRACTSRERALIGAIPDAGREDAIDALGLGLWLLGRIGGGE
jgi:hypothetical protein